MSKRLSELTCAGMLILAAACTSGSPTAAPAAKPTVSRTPSLPTPTRSPNPSHNPAPAHLHVVVKVGDSIWPTAMIQVGSLLYAGYHATGNHAGQGIMRLNPVTGSLHRGPAIPGWKPSSEALVLADGSLWIPVGRRGTGTAGNSLARVRPDTLQVTRTIALPYPPKAVTATPAGLWVAAGSHLLLIDMGSGAVTRTVTVPGRIKLLASDPAGDRLYVSTNRKVGANSDLLAEYDASTGAPVAKGSEGFHELHGPSGMVATDGGVWVTSPTGMMAGLTFHRASDLSELPAPEGQDTGSNGMSAYLAGGKLWVSDVQRLSCLDPATGKELGRVRVTDAAGPIAGDRTVYAWTRNGLAAIDPLPAGCR